MAPKQPSCLGFLGFVAALVVGFVAVGALVFWRMGSTDQSSLTEAGVAEVTSREKSGSSKSGRDWFIEYRYERGGTTFAGRTYVYTSSPPAVGGTERVCVDPEKPREHAVVLDLAANCGDKDLGGKTEKARIAP